MEPESRLEELLAQVRKHGMRLTPQRAAVLKALATSPNHPTAEEIYQQVRQDFPMTSLATIYKTIALLKELGEIQELSFGAGSSRFDCFRSSPHPHLICTRCNTIVDIDGHAFNEITQPVAQSTGYQIFAHRLELFGVCPRCQQE